MLSERRLDSRAGAARAELSSRRVAAGHPPLSSAADENTALLNNLEGVAEALRCSEQELQQLRMAVRGSSDGLWGWTVQSNEVWFAPRFKELLGYRDDELPSSYEAWETRLHPEDREWVLTALRNHVRTDAPYDVTYRLLTKSGDYNWYRARGKSVRDDNGVSIYMAGSLQDVTDLKIAEQKLAQSNAALARSNADLEQFAYAASHDLRAPLRAIANLAEWIETDLKERLDDENRRRFDLLRTRVARLDRLIEDLLKYSRAGRVLGRIEPVACGLLVEEIVDLLGVPPGMRVVANGPLPTLTTAVILLQQVLTNLVSNAIKHHDRPMGRVEIAARDVADFVEFSVADDGPGIPPEHQQRVFGMFETLKPRDAVEGSGMGLAIVKRMVEAVGGTIRVESDGQRGSTFRFTWPRTLQPPQAAVTAAPTLA
ncbi:MAG: Adaptive-response sensory-kinase SasA [Phycisphaerae bacterium]|nr:Adaptive-response sensory-kinase SasA [Phycisphaerae bacterium]